jgi:hypothetical protein
LDGGEFCDIVFGSSDSFKDRYNTCLEAANGIMKEGYL